MKPIIGLTMHADSNKTQINDAYIDSIMKAGGIPICLPYVDGADVARVVDQIDGLCLIGGHDIDPRFFDAEPHRAIGETNRRRDESELAYFYEAFERDMPIFGICRGHQLINVALGGTLIQDIPSEKKDAICHRQQAGRGETTHQVYVSPGMLYEVLGVDRVFVNSFHHQAVHHVAEELEAVAIASDGIVEALEHPTKKFCLSVQWHPEELSKVGDEFALRLFRAFIEACEG